MVVATHDKRMAYVGARMKAFGRTRVQKVLRVGREGAQDLISGALLIALGLRETGLRNVLGDYDVKVPDWAHARGLMQIHDKFHMDWLETVPGCRALPRIPAEPMSLKDKLATRAAWLRIPGKKASARGMCPTAEDGARYATELLKEYVDQAQRAGVKRPEDQIAVALAAYNCGFGGAIDGFFAGNVDMNTTGGDYSADVLRRRGEVNQWLRLHPNWKA